MDWDSLLNSDQISSPPPNQAGFFDDKDGYEYHVHAPSEPENSISCEYPYIPERKDSLSHEDKAHTLPGLEDPISYESPRSRAGSLGGSVASFGSYGSLGSRKGRRVASSHFVPPPVLCAASSPWHQSTWGVFDPDSDLEKVRICSYALANAN